MDEGKCLPAIELQDPAVAPAGTAEGWLLQPRVQLRPVQRRWRRRQPGRPARRDYRALKRGLDKAIDTLIILVLVLFVLALGFWIYDTQIDPLLRRMSGYGSTTSRGGTSLWPGLGQLSSPEEALFAPLPYVPANTTVQIQERDIPAPTPAPGTETPTFLDIPALDVHSPVVEVTIQGGVWQVAEYAAGYHRGTARPGTVGNTVISGHKGLTGAVFARLEEINLGEMVYVTAGSHEYQYQVTEKKSVWPSQVEVMAPTSTPILTLITCTAYDTQRLIVVARLVQGYPSGTSANP